MKLRSVQPSLKLRISSPVTKQIRFVSLSSVNDATENAQSQLHIIHTYITLLLLVLYFIITITESAN